MKFLLDMGLSQTTAKFLRQQGHDAVHLRDEELQCLPDDDIISKARAEERVVLTHDLDFGRIMALSRQHLPQRHHLPPERYATTNREPPPVRGAVAMQSTPENRGLGQRNRSEDSCSPLAGKRLRGVNRTTSVDGTQHHAQAPELTIRLKHLSDPVKLKRNRQTPHCSARRHRI